MTEPGGVTEAALDYRSRNWWVTPVTGKAPVLENWPNVRLDEESIQRSFNGHNVGVVLGPSGLADLDFDDPVAVKALRALRSPELEGAVMFQHRDRPHLIVKATGVKTRRFQRADGSTLVELRSDGAQTVFPPSIHADGLPYEWVRDGEPCEIAPQRLNILASMIATVAYVSEFWTEGTRHELALSLAGFLARRLAEEDVLAVVRAVATVSGDADFRDREAGVVTTVRRLTAGEPVTGLPSLNRIDPDLGRALGSWWGTVVLDDDKGEERNQGRPSQADALVDIGSKAELFHDPSGAGFARILIGEHQEIWPLSSKRFKNWLRREHYLRSGKAPNSEAVSSACGVLEGIAAFDGPCHELFNRVAWFEGAIYYDLADASWRAIRIDADGWGIVERPPILFRRYAHQKAQVEPVPGGDAREVLRFLNVGPGDELLLLVWLIADFVPDIPHPIPDFHGEKGSGKSVGQRVLRNLIDPSGIESLAFPTDVRELVQQLSHHYAPIYDNVDNLPPWISDVICRAITGEGFSKRELYSDDEDVIYSYRRVIMLNGVNVVPSRSDLLDRSILIMLSRIPRQERREERELWSEFGKALPCILGGIFDVLSQALRLYPSTELPTLERMADFTRWGAAIAEALGDGAGAFVMAYEANLNIQTREAVEGHIVGAAILALMDGLTEWSGTPSDLLGALEAAGDEAKLFKRSTNGKISVRGWPGAPHILTRRLNEIRSNLRDLGFEITEDRVNERTITIRRIDRDNGQSSVDSVGSVAQIRMEPDPPDATDATEAEAHRGSVAELASPAVRVDATDGTDATSSILTKPTEPCAACHGDSWWQRPDGGWVCGTCHPDPRQLIAAARGEATLE